MSMLDQLIDMGYPAAMAEKALRETGEAGLEEAVDWIAEHQDEDEKTNTHKDASSVVEFREEKNTVVNGESSAGEPVSQPVPQAMSFKCDECGKQLGDENAVMFHAARTKHEKFSESTEVVKPLSEEEKKKQLEKLQKKLKEARAKKEEQERKEELEKESLKEKRRRMEGKSMLKLEEERKEMEMKKMVEQKRREKKEEEAARKRVLEQIRLDREARKAAANLAAHQAPVPAPPPAAVPSSNSVNDTGFCQIQVRLPDGSVLKEKFKSDEPLSHVRLWVELNGANVMQGQKFSLMTPFPKKIFNSEDMDAPLKALGLIPSATLIATRTHS